MSMQFLCSLFQSFAVSTASVRGEKLKTFLTILIIAVGIASLTGSVMAVNALSTQIHSTFSRLGAGLISVLPNYNQATGRKLNCPAITEFQAAAFVQHSTNGKSSVSARYDQPVHVSYMDKLVPNVTLLAVDSSFFSLRELDVPNNLMTRSEQSFTCLVSKALAERLLEPAAGIPLSEPLRILSYHFLVAGIIDQSDYTPGAEYYVLVPSAQFHRYLSSSHESFIDVSCGQISSEKSAEIESKMRAARRLRPYDKSDFTVADNRSVAGHTAVVLERVSDACLAVALVSLLGASVALMNTLLVGINARKREIGLYMAMGATKAFVRLVFITEAFLYGIAGGFIGVLAGVLVAYPVSLVLDSVYELPAGWILLSFLVSLLVCLLSACLPSEKAVKLSPVKALSSR